MHRLNGWQVSLVMVLGVLPFFLLFGCGSLEKSLLDPASTVNIQGMVRGGQHTIAGSMVQMYAAGSTGNGSSSKALLAHPVQTGSDGGFTISGPVACPSASSPVYLVATGGNPGLSAGVENSSIALMANLGSCGDLSKVSFATINEVTTVGSIWPLAAYARSASQIGFGNMDVQGFDAAEESMGKLVNVAEGTAPGPMLVTGDVPPTAKLHTLANILAACVDSTGGRAGDGSACGRLFLTAASEGSAAPTDTLAAAIAVSQNPAHNVDQIYSLVPSTGAFGPDLLAPPADWTLPVLSVPAEPSISPDTGIIGQTVTITAGSPDSLLFYTVDGSVPTASSLPYSAPIALSSSQTIQAVAVKGGLSSAVASRTFNLSSLPLVVTPGAMTLTATKQQKFTAAMGGVQQRAVAWSLSPAVGTISSAGLYIAPSSISSAQTVTVTATTLTGASHSGSASITLAPPVSVAVTPGSVTLTSSGTQAFTAAVAGTSNTAVTWSLNPAVGSISTAGVYTAPATISAAQSVTVTATSVADSTKSASASISLAPPVGVAVSPGSTTLTASRTQAFTAVLTGTSNTGVTWSLNPAVGSISSAGVYTAPATISAAQSVSVTATSVADSTKSASASISLAPPVGVTLNVGAVTLTSSATQMFTASVTGTTNTAVTWTLSPAVGTLSGGLYTAPATISAAQTVTVTATSVADSSNSASASVSLVANNGPISTFYVDNVNGNDLNRGDSPTTAFATIAKVNSLALTGGQTVAFKAGDEWHEVLTLSHSGTSGAPITFTSYGSGAQPIISAADTVSGWTQGTGVAAQETCSAPAFCSGFEAPGFSDWTSASTSNNDSYMNLSTARSNHGATSMAVTSANGSDTRGWVTRSIAAPGPNGTLSVRWYFLAPAGSLKPNNALRMLYLTSGGTQVGFATLTTDGTGTPSAIDFYDTEHSLRILNPTPLTGYVAGQWNELEIDIAISSTNGGGTVYLNGNLLSQLNNIDTSGDAGIDAVSLGNLAYGGAVAPGGTIYFDDVKMSTSANVGTFSGGIPTNVWYRGQTADPKLINFSGQAGTPVSSVGAITAVNQFSWDGSRLYVYSAQNPTNLVEVPQRDSAVTSSGASYITFQNLQFQGGRTYNVFCGQSVRSCDHWDFETDTFTAGYSNELYIQPYPGTLPAGPTVRNSTFKGSGANGIALAGPGATGAYIVNNEFYDLSKIYNTAYSQNTWSDAIEGYSGDASDGAGTYIGYNNIHDIGIGQSQIYGGGIHPDTVTGWTIEHNTIRNINAAGINLEKGSNNTARYNLIVNGGQLPYQAGLVIRAGDGSSVSNALVEYNTMYGGWWACNLQIQQNAGAVAATNITFRKNICAGANSNTQFYADAGWNGSGNSITNNNFGVAANYWVILGQTIYSSYGSLSAPVTGSIPGDPLFVNPAGGNFTLQANSPASGIGAFPQN